MCPFVGIGSPTPSPASVAPFRVPKWEGDTIACGVWGWGPNSDAGTDTLVFYNTKISLRCQQVRYSCNDKCWLAWYRWLTYGMWPCIGNLYLKLAYNFQIFQPTRSKREWQKKSLKNCWPPASQKLHWPNTVHVIISVKPTLFHSNCKKKIHVLNIARASKNFKSATALPA